MGNNNHVKNLVLQRWLRWLMRFSYQTIYRDLSRGLEA